MTSDADTATPGPPFVCGVICGDALEEHVEAFRVWAGLLWELTIDALLSSGTIERPDDVYDKALWDGLIATDMLPNVKIKTRRLSARAWSYMLRGDDVRGFGLSARPRPHVPMGPDSTVDISSGWQAHHIIPNSVGCSCPPAFATTIDDGWATRLVNGFVAFGIATRVRAGLIGWLPPTTFTAYPEQRPTTAQCCGCRAGPCS